MMEARPNTVKDFFRGVLTKNRLRTKNKSDKWQFDFLRHVRSPIPLNQTHCAELRSDTVPFELGKKKVLPVAQLLFTPSKERRTKV